MDDFTFGPSHKPKPHKPRGASWAGVAARLTLWIVGFGLVVNAQAITKLIFG